MVKGTSVIVLLNGTQVACTRTNNIRHLCDLIPFSSPATAQSKEYISGDKQWSVEVSWLVGTIYIPLTKILQVGNKFTLRFGISSSVSVGGEAILKECNITANIGQLLTGSFVFQGTGDLSDD